MKTIQLSLQVVDDIAFIDSLGPSVNPSGSIYVNVNSLPTCGLNFINLKAIRIQPNQSPTAKKANYNLGQPTQGLENSLRSSSFPSAASEVPTVSAHT